MCERILKYFLLSLMAISVVGCKDDEPEPEPEVPVEEGHAAFVLNEGTFQWGNASLSHIKLTTSEIQEDIFAPANNRPVGDVLQSAAMIDGKIWLAVNNSQKIERIDPKTAVAIAPIDGLQSPRYMLEAKPGKVYVTDLYADRIHVINVESGTVSGSIETRGWTEELLLHNGLVWVCNTDLDKLFVIDPNTDQIVDSVQVGDKPRSIKKDLGGKLWVLCEGEIPPAETAGSLVKVDPEARTVLQTFTMPLTTDHPTRLQTNVAGSELYFLLHGIYKMNIQSTELPTSAWIEANGRVFYGLGIHQDDESVWVSDARDYVQKGKVYRYNQQKTEIGSWDVGVIPCSFYFY
jgi:YVTN family beta-propeller protein